MEWAFDIILNPFLANSLILCLLKTPENANTDQKWVNHRTKDRSFFIVNPFGLYIFLNFRYLSCLGVENLAGKSKLNEDLIYILTY